MVARLACGLACGNDKGLDLRPNLVSLLRQTHYLLCAKAHGLPAARIEAPAKQSTGARERSDRVKRMERKRKGG